MTFTFILLRILSYTSKEFKISLEKQFKLKGIKIVSAKTQSANEPAKTSFWSTQYSYNQR